MAAGASLLPGSDQRLSHLKEAYELAKYAQEDAEAGVVLRPVLLDPKEIIIVTYADASYGNAAGSKRQGGILVCLTSREALRGEAAATLVGWRSGRIRRVVRSTLAAEASSADAAIDHGEYVNAMLTELVGAATATPGEKAQEVHKSLAHAVTTQTQVGSRT